MTEINMERVVEILRTRGVAAYVEQTGGGCATIYAGPTREEPNYGTRYAAAAGPGWFTGPGWTEARAETGDFCIGADDYGDVPPLYIDDDTFPGEGVTDEKVADLIQAQVVKNEYPTLPVTA